MRKLGISLVALIITIVVLVILTGAVVITGMNVTGQAQLAVFYNNVTNIQDAVTMKMTTNMIQYGNTGKIEKYKWVGIVPDYTAEMAGAEGNYPAFGDIVINGENTVALSSEIKASMNISETEANNYRVGKSGTVYHTGYVYEGNTYYNRELVATGTKPVLTGVSALSDGTYHEDKGVNSPKLLPGMVAVYWTGSVEAGNLKEIRSDGVGNNGETFNYGDWYDYTASHWANAITTADGSYWVWIPRYAYNITSGYGTSTTGTIGIKFLKGASNTAGDNITQWDNTLEGNKWNIHPAFYYDGDSETGTQLTGIWVAKYEMSAEIYNEETTPNWVPTPIGAWYDGNTAINSGYNVEPVNGTIDNSNILTISAGGTALANDIRAVSKPGVSSWRNINSSTAFANALAYDSGIGNAGLDSHMMKNSEWGAVAYLTQSVHGKNSEIIINNSPKFVTGYARDTATGEYYYERLNAEADTDITDNEKEMYATARGVQASSTGNIYGIYDLSGGAWERISAYVDNGHPNLQVNSKNLVSNRNTGYVDVYHASVLDTPEANYGTVRMYGDAIIETSANGVGNSSWYKDFSGFTFNNAPAFVRGGYFRNGTNAGVFCFIYATGSETMASSWRVVLR